ncbi:MAG: TonB-dependent receptor [Acidobacteria bacterium]|nr:TonB-dependent receptor [Acidobacteriota bacterium]
MSTSKLRWNHRRAAACKALFLPAMVLLLSASMAMAQLTTGTINGTVTDQSGAAVPGANVTAKNTETGASRATVTGPTGRYEFPSMPGGTYEVTATSQGFQTSVRSGVALSLGQNLVVNHSLQVGEVTQSVTVTGEASLVETSTATVTQLVDEEKVQELPLRERDLTQLAFLQPGVIRSPAGRGVFGGMGDKMIIGGARGTQNLFLLDGVSNSDLSNNPQGASGSYTGAETIKEFQIITNNYSAEYQSAAGGIVSAVTKSGTNTLHGSGFWTLRNDNMDANSFSNNRRGLNKREFKRNQFGGSLGGPVIQDKTFFFGSYEGFRVRDTDQDTVDVWTDATRARAVASMIPYLDLWPRPNTPYQYSDGESFPILQDNGDGTVRLVGGGKDQDPVNEDFVGAKFDYQFANPKMGFLSGSYNYSDSDALPDSIMRAVTLTAGTSSTKHTLGVGHTSVVSSTVINEFKFGYSWSELFGDLPVRPADLSNLANLTGRKFTGQINPPFASNVGFRTLSSQYVQKAYQFREGITFSSGGSHSFRAGTELKLFRYLQDSCSRGCNGVWTWRNLNDFLANTPRRLEIFQPGHDNPVRNLKQLLFGTYFQDNWQVMPSLTLNLGLRWEFTSVPKEENNLVATLRQFNDACVTVTQAVKDDPRYAKDCFESDTIDQFFTNPTLKSFSPRIGFAWAPGAQKFSIRGGAGIFYEYPMLYNIRTVLQESPPFVLTGRAEASAVLAAGLPKMTLRPGVGSEPSLVPFLASTPNVRAMEYDQKNVTIHRWSLTVQQELPAGFVASVGYTGSRATHLWHQSIANINKWVGWPEKPSGLKTFPALGSPEFNALTTNTTCFGVATRSNLVNPCFGEMRIQSSNADSYFHGLAIGFQKRLSRGLQMQLAYNFAKSIDTGSGVTSGGDELPQGQRGIYFWDMELKRGLSQFDIRHSMSSNWIYELPTQNLTGPIRWVLGGWRLNGILTLTGGHPLSVTDSNVGTADAINDDESLRANLIAGGDNNPVRDSRDPFNYYDATQFLPVTCTAVPSRVGSIQNALNQGIPVCRAGDAEYQPGHFGSAGRNTLSSPGIATLDFSIEKNFNVMENHRIQFRAEFFNLFNRANYNEPDTSPYNSDGVPDPTFWRTDGQITGAGAPRTIQLSLKYNF